MDQTWNENTPADTDLISGGDDIIRELKKAIRERLDVEHVFTTGNEATVGEHAPGFITEAKGYIGALAVTNANLKGSIDISKILTTQLTSGVYTPTLISSSAGITVVTLYNTFYIRVGNVVFVCGKFSLTLATGYSYMYLSLPIASNLGASTDAAGFVNATRLDFEITGSVNAEPSNDTLSISFNQTFSGGPLQISGSFIAAYQVL